MDSNQINVHPQVLTDLNEEAEYTTYEEQAAKVEEPEDESYFNPAGKELPKYYLTRQKDGWIKAISRDEYGTIRRKQVTRVYQKVPMCGHKFVPGAQPRHRNCESCYFSFFNVHGELTQSIEELYAKHGAQPVIKLLGPKVLKNFLKFMSTVAAFKAAQEAKAQAVKDAYVAPSEEKHGSISTVEQGSGENHSKPKHQRTHASRKLGQSELFQEG